jgi:hypothetical protein
LKAAEKTVNVLSTFFSRGIAILALYIFIIFVSIAISLWLGDLLGKVYYGFFCVAVFYGIITSVIYFFMHNWIKKITGNAIVKHMI